MLTIDKLAIKLQIEPCRSKSNEKKDDYFVWKVCDNLKKEFVKFGC